jgi:hypothetical protein
MSGWARPADDRGDPDEVYPPGERFQPHPPINWRAEIYTFVLTSTILAALYITGLKAVLQRYVPDWVFGLVFIGFGLFCILRPRALANTSRYGALIYGGFMMLFGVYLFIHFLP